MCLMTFKRVLWLSDCNMMCSDTNHLCATPSLIQLEVLRQCVRKAIINWGLYWAWDAIQSNYRKPRILDPPSNVHSRDYLYLKGGQENGCCIFCILIYFGCLVPDVHQGGQVYGGGPTIRGLRYNLFLCIRSQPERSCVTRPVNQYRISKTDARP